MHGLEALQNRGSGGVQANATQHAHRTHEKPDHEKAKKPTASNDTYLQQYSLQESYSQQRNFELQIKTKDGDTVTINVAAEQLQSLVARQQSGTDGSITQSRYAEKNSLKFSYSVQGTLDEDEQKALDSLFSDANKLAESFYSGNVEEAFAQAGKMQFNTDEIASFSLKMSQSEAYSKSEAYQQVQKQTESVEPEKETPNNPNELFRKIGKFLFDAAEFLRHHADEANNNKQAKALLEQLPSTEENKNKWQEFLAGAFKNLG